MTISPAFTPQTTRHLTRLSKTFVCKTAPSNPRPAMRPKPPTLSATYTDRTSRNRPWLNVQTIHNALVQNHFLDILDYFAAHHGLQTDSRSTSHDRLTSFSLRMQTLSRHFRRQVAAAFIKAQAAPADAVIIATDPPDGDVAALCERTMQAVRERRKLIVGAVVHDAVRRLFARVPILIRGDVANRIFGVHVPGDRDRVYVAVGVKRRAVDMAGDGRIKKKSLERMQVEMWLWNKMLSDMQGVDVQFSLIVGLHPRRTLPVSFGAHPPVSNNATLDDNNVFDASVWRMAIVPFGAETCSKGIAALEALKWRIHVVDEGAGIIGQAEQYLAKSGKRREAGDAIVRAASCTKDVRWRPNMKIAFMYDWPWVKAKKSVAMQLCELTLVSGVSRACTSKAMESGIPNDYRREEVTAEALNIRSLYTQLVLTMNKPGYDGVPVVPDVIPHNRANWRQLVGFNHSDISRFDKGAGSLPLADQRTFYVDFELASPENLFECLEDGDCDRVFEDCGKGEKRVVEGEALIFMIGCGQVIEGEWIHKVFTAETLSREGEGEAVCAWLSHMYSVMPVDHGTPILNVWGPEKSLLRKAMRRMSKERVAKIGNRKSVQYVDMWQVVTTGCLAVKGGLTNSLKSVVKSLEDVGRLDVIGGRCEEDFVCDGGGAMAVALAAEEECQRGNVSRLADLPQMKEVAKYNEADCRDIARVADYLRRNH